MHTPSTEKLATTQGMIKGFGLHYNYDVSYLQELGEASPGALMAFFDAAALITRFQKAAPTELLFLAKITATRVEDCGPCVALGVKMAREAKVPEAIIRGALRDGGGLSDEHLDVYRYTRAVAAHETIEPELLARITERWGREVIAELALAILSGRLYPTIKRALGHAQSCSLTPELVS